MKKMLLGILIGIIIGYWSVNNFVEVATNGWGKDCITNSPFNFDTLCVWSRNPFGNEPWTLKFSYDLPFKF